MNATETRTTAQIIDNRILRDAIATGGQLSAWDYAGTTSPSIARAIVRLQHAGLLTADLWITPAGRAQAA